MARRKAQAGTPLAGKVDFTPPPETTAKAGEFHGVDGVASPLEARVAQLEASLAALCFAFFNGRAASGATLERCRCGCFATRKVSILHPVAGIQREGLCSECKLWSPLATEGVPVMETELFADIAERAHVVSVNQGIRQAMQWGAA